MKLTSIPAGMLLAVLAGCATAEIQPSAAVTTVTPDALRVFKIDWEAVPDRDGDRRLIVLDPDGATLRGLLCLTADRTGFCQSG